MFTKRSTKPVTMLALCCAVLLGTIGNVHAVQDDKKPRPPKAPAVVVPAPKKEKDPPRDNDKGGKKNDEKKGDGKVLASFFRRFVG